MSKRQDRPAAIAWIVKFHPELSDAQISKLIGTTKPTIQSIRARTHWNIANFQPVDPVALGLCKQGELDAMVTKSGKKKSDLDEVINDEKRSTIVSTDESLSNTDSKIPSSIVGLEEFSLKPIEDEKPKLIDPEALFSLPNKNK